MNRALGRTLLVAILVLGLGAAYLAVEARDGDTDGRSGDGRVLAADLSSDWQSFGEVPLSPRKIPVALATSTQGFIVGGHQEGSDPRSNRPVDDGALLDFTTGEWSELPRLPDPLANPDGLVVNGTLLVSGISCADLDLEVGLDSCEPGVPVIASLAVDDIERGWEYLPIDLAKGTVLRAVGAVEDWAAFQVSPEGELALVTSEGGEVARVDPPAPLTRGRLCASNNSLTAVAVQDAVSGETEPSPEPGEVEVVEPPPELVTATRTSWTLTPSEGDGWSEPASLQDDALTARGLVPICAAGGAIVTDTAGQDAAYFDSANREWARVEPSPVPLSVGPRPMLSTTASKTALSVEDASGHRQVEFDNQSRQWVEVELPPTLSKQRPRAISSGGTTSILIGSDGRMLELWARSVG